MTRIHRTGAWLAVTALLLASSLALAQGSQEKTQPTQGEKHAVVQVKGMSCPFCAFGLKKHLQRLAGVKNVDVSLEKGEAYLNVDPNAKLADDEIRKAVRDAGFTSGEIKWHSLRQESQTKQEKR